VASASEGDNTGEVQSPFLQGENPGLALLVVPSNDLIEGIVL
jgi:hypothetical protein